VRPPKLVPVMVGALVIATASCAASHQGGTGRGGATSLPVSTSAAPQTSPPAPTSVTPPTISNASPPVQTSPTLPPGGLPPAPVPTPAPTLVSPTVLTQQPYGAVVKLKVGEQVLLEPGIDWVRPTITGVGLRMVAVSGGYPSRQPLKATLLAVAAGTAHIDDYTDAACFHETPRCLRATEELNFTVVITE
jgi:hypothetical protein